VEETRAGAFGNAGAFARGADVLAGEAGGDDVNGVEAGGGVERGGVEGADVIVDGDVGPVVGQHLARVRGLLHERDRAEAAEEVLRGVGEAADAGEGVEQR
jgi:hypothetical protein